MSTSNLSQTAPLVAPRFIVGASLPPLFAWVSGALHRVRALQMPVVEIQEPSEQTSHQISLLATPLRFSGKSIYTPQQDWNGFR
jgi:hypothetical protein